MQQIKDILSIVCLVHEQKIIFFCRLCVAGAPARCLAVLGRVALRRGDRPAGEEHWRRAMEQVIAARDPVLVLRIARGWGEGQEEGGRPEEGGASSSSSSEVPKRLVAEACAVMKRPVEEVLREFNAEYAAAATPPRVF